METKQEQICLAPTEGSVTQEVPWPLKPLDQHTSQENSHFHAFSGFLADALELWRTMQNNRASYCISLLKDGTRKEC